MEFKNKIWVRFFGSKQQARDKQVPERVVQEKQQAVAVAPQPSHPQVSETELRFPQEHALSCAICVYSAREEDPVPG